MKGKDVNERFLELIKRDQAKYGKDYQLFVDRVKNSSAQYRGKPVPTLYNPMFITEDNLEDFRKIGETMMAIANKITDRYINDREFRKKFGFPKLIEDLIEIDNGYDIHVPIGRFDIFYKDGETFKFCELNTDGSSAMNEDNTLAKIMLESEGAKDFKKDYELEYFELFDTWVEDIIKIFHKYDPNKEKPNVAIVDFTESGTTPEFEEFKKRFIRQGYNCIIADPRNLEYKDGKLWHKDYKIDLVYRRIVTFELIDKADEIPDFIAAYKDKAFCCVGSIRSQVIHNKIFFKILHDEDTLEGLNQKERDFVKRHIPDTGIFAGDRKTFNKVLNNKDKYIMKPMDLNASQGVYAGRDFSQSEWEKKLKKSWKTDYLYQEFVEPYTRDFLVYKDGEFKEETYGSIIGLYMYNEKLAGIYSRVGPNNIISGATEYYTLPSILVKNT